MKILFLLFALARASTIETHGLASETIARASAVVRERDSFEARIHTQLDKWCNATLPAQQSRQSALRHLLLQAQSSTTPVGPEAAAGTELAQMEAQAAALGSELEGRRLLVQASKSSTKREMRSNRLDLDDAARNVDALQRAYDQLGGVKAPANAGVKAAANLLAQAKSMKQQAQQKVQLLQTHAAAGSVSNLSKLETEYRTSKADIVSSLHQYYTTQRSLDVLASALEDESEYLADLKSICGAESLVHARLANHVLPMLRGAPALAAKDVAVNKVAETKTATPKPAPRAVPAKSVEAKPIVTPEGAKRKALKVAETKTAMPKPALRAIPAKSAAAKPIVTPEGATPKAALKAASPKPILAHKHAFTQVASKPTATKVQPAVSHKVSKSMLVGHGKTKANTHKQLSTPKAAKSVATHVKS
jgi:hypothetical protein